MHGFLCSQHLAFLMADAGHAKGVPEGDDIKRYQSINGYFLFLANKEADAGGRSFAFSEAVEAGNWLAVLLDEAWHGRQNLKNWDQIAEKRRRIPSPFRLPAPG
eukprot:s2397_g15.t1